VRARLSVRALRARRYTLLDLLVLAMLARVVLLPRFAAIFHPLDGGTARIWGRLVDQEIDTWSRPPPLVLSGHAASLNPY
jgi:hypothetical protein